MSRVEDTSIQLCRLCLRNTTGCISVFSDLFGAEDVELTKVIKSCVGVEVRRGDGFTCMVCGPCHKMVLKFHDFKSSCLESQWRLKHMPRWATEGPRDPLEGTGEQDVIGRAGKAAAKEDGLERVSSTSLDKGEIIDNTSGRLWPVALWSVSEGFWRANTVNNEETIVSDPVDVNDNSSVNGNHVRSSAVDLDSGRASPSSQSTDSAIHDTAYVDHNYSTQPTEPLQLCSVVMEHVEDDDDEMPLAESGVVKTGKEKEKETIPTSDLKNGKRVRQHKLVSVLVGNKPVGVVKEYDSRTQTTSKGLAPVVASPVMPSSLQMSLLKQKATNGKMISVTKEQLTADLRRSLTLHKRSLLPKPAISKEMVKSNILAAKINNGKIILKNGTPNGIQRIVIKGGSTMQSKGKHIPMVKGLRFTPELMLPKGAKCSIFKVKKFKNGEER